VPWWNTELSGLTAKTRLFNREKRTGEQRLLPVKRKKSRMLKILMEEVL
jgi:hypothetical protein